MHQIVIKHLQDRFQSFLDLAGKISEAELHENLEVTNSKNLTTHMWCIIGARESYTKALVTGSWAGFKCSLSEYNVASIQDGLRTSSQAFNNALETIDTWTPERQELLVTLMEHEVMHEGQIIRLWLALGHELPKSVKWA